MSRRCQAGSQHRGSSSGAAAADGWPRIASTVSAPGRPEPVTIRRRAVYQALTDDAQRAGVLIEYGKRLVGVDELDDGVRARFADGNSATAYLLVDADGIHSTTRAVTGGSPSAHMLVPLVFKLADPGKAQTAVHDYTIEWTHGLPTRRRWVHGVVLPRADHCDRCPVTTLQIWRGTASLSDPAPATVTPFRGMTICSWVSAGYFGPGPGRHGCGGGGASASGGTYGG